MKKFKSNINYYLHKVNKKYLIYSFAFTLILALRYNISCRAEIYDASSDTTIDSEINSYYDSETDLYTNNEIDIYADTKIETDDISEDSSQDLVENFVRRLYEIILERPADPEGLNGWTNQLKTKNNTGAQVIEGFIFSIEFKEKNISNQNFIEILYLTCLNRGSDKIGLSEWLECMDTGFSRRYIVKGFVDSNEFRGLCIDYGIESGTLTLYDAIDKNENITRFIGRCYKIFLNRYPDSVGLSDWLNVVLKNPSEAQQLPIGFVFSQEMNAKNLPDENFIQILYQGILDREPDGEGLSAWVNCLKNGQTRQDVCNGFLYSEEFGKLLGKYGLPFNTSQTHEGLNDLKKAIINSTAKIKGTWSVYVKDLNSQEFLLINDTPMRSASVIKLFVMEAVYSRIEKGYIVQTSSINSLLNSMITVSSNEAMNELVRRLSGVGSNQLGAAILHAYLKEQGYSSTHLGGALQPSATPNILYGGNTTTSAKECGEILEKIYRGECVSPIASNQMLQLLLRQQKRSKIPSGLPSGTKCGNKTGENNVAENDVAIVFSPATDYVVCILCNNFSSSAAARTKIREISSIVYRYFN